ncbi:hypothetical protein [Pedobacter sp. B4-66]|uniref:hypothetical protein n=1 Tax=Pedobacter sp. B4-66 TaxID=2817280 RepID=UPI001BDA81EC|nr:hypothetical protein [Pedobacter sp. B4-66]
MNIIAYEARDTSINNNQYMYAGESFLEIVLDDILDIPGNTHDDIEIPNESYRLFNVGVYILPAIVLFLSFFLVKQIGKIIIIFHPLYKAKSFCLPSYYSHLFRLKPF